MNSHIKGIAAFRDNTSEGKRILALSPGLNIISGNSKTGKSAILDIIDWCLGADLCTIPKGVITDFTEIYSILIDFNGKTVLLARENELAGKHYMFINEVSSRIQISDINYSDFSRELYIKKGEALEKLNEIIDLTLTIGALPIEVESKLPKTNIRHTLPYMFQHQDIIDSNSRLFYFEPNPKHFPVLAGWFGQEYYIVLKKIDSFKTQIKNLVKTQTDAIKANARLEENFRNSFRIYYSLIGLYFDENLSIKQLKNKCENLEEFKKEEFDDAIQKRQEVLEKQLNDLYAEQTNLNRQYSKINAKKEHGTNYKIFLERYNERIKYFDIRKDYECPICSKQNDELSIEALTIIEAEEWLKNELVNIPTHTIVFDKEKIEVSTKLSENKVIIKKLKDEYVKNNEIIEKIVKEKNVNEQKQRARWKVISDFEILVERSIPFDEKFLESIKASLLKFEEKKKTFNISDKYLTEKKIIEDRMSLIVEKLDFEHRPPELYFELNQDKEDCFRLYHNAYGEERIYLRQIGSASNALACHLALFLSFLNYFCHQEKSKVPSILFFDQPSQVYFPSGKDNNDIEKVGQIYETLLNEIQTIESETGITPQIIVADHVRDLEEGTVKLYEHYFKADWRNGEKFI